MPWKPGRWKVRPHLERDELWPMMLAGQWTEVVERADAWRAAWPEQLAPYSYQFIGLTHTQGVPAAVAWARATLPTVNPLIEAYLCAAIVLHLIEPPRAGDWSELDEGSQEAELVTLAERAHRLGAGRVKWASCVLPVVRALQGRTEEARELATQARAAHELVAIELGWLAAVDGLTSAGDGNAEGARHWLSELRRMSPESRYLPGLEASLEIADAGGLAAYRRT